MKRAEPKRAVHHGKWSLPGVPHKGWQFRDFDDLGDIVGICEMCETQPIRYVHYLGHPDYPDVLGVGSVCAEIMEEDYVAARERESAIPCHSSSKVDERRVAYVPEGQRIPEP